MRTLIFTLLLSGTFFTFAQSMAEDHAAIAQTLNYYMEGGTNGDYETLSRAFHEDARMTFIRDGEFTSVNALEFFSGMQAGRISDRETRIASIDVSGHAATAKLELIYATFKFNDYMQLLKIDGEWKIISKTFYRETLAQEEG